MQHYHHNCSREYIDRLHASLFSEIQGSLESLLKRQTQTEINHDIFQALVERGWAYDSAPEELKTTQGQNHRDLCLTTTTLDAKWHSDFAKSYDSGIVQVEAQFGKVESMFKDFCGFQIAYHERRLVLGIEIVMNDPLAYFAHRKASVSGMAYFEIARKTLPAIGLSCPIWLIGI